MKQLNVLNYSYIETELYFNLTLVACVCEVCVCVCVCVCVRERESAIVCGMCCVRM